MRSLLFLALLACAGGSQDGSPKESEASPETGKPHTGSPHTGSQHSGSPHSGESGSEGPMGPAQAHAEPTDGTMCFACHLCGNDGAETLETTHWVCVDCHRGPDGSVPEEVQSDCGCGALDCSTEPPTLGCEGCHVLDGTNGYPSTQHMNSLCSECHTPGQDAARPGAPSPHR